MAVWIGNPDKIMKVFIGTLCRFESFHGPKKSRTTKIKNMKKGLVIGISLVVLSFAIIMCGFNTHQTTIDSYSTEFSTYVLAKYSEIESGIDFSGNFYTETNYWDEEVSVVWFISTVKGDLIEYNCPIHLIDGYTCDTPKITIEHTKGTDFDRYQEIRSVKYYVDYGDGDFSTVDNEEYNAALLKLGKNVIVKTWYGNAYGFEY